MMTLGAGLGTGLGIGLNIGLELGAPAPHAGIDIPLLCCRRSSSWR